MADGWMGARTHTATQFAAWLPPPPPPPTCISNIHINSQSRRRVYRRCDIYAVRDGVMACSSANCPFDPHDIARVRARVCVCVPQRLRTTKLISNDARAHRLTHTRRVDGGAPDADAGADTETSTMRVCVCVHTCFVVAVASAQAQARDQPALNMMQFSQFVLRNISAIL